MSNKKTVPQNKNNKTALVTMGRTKSFIDPVRYLSNESSGKMGLALFNALQQNNIKTDTLVGETSVVVPTTYKAGTNQEMIDCLKAKIQHYDLIFFCAAGNDFEPEHVSPTKINQTKLSDSFTFRFKKSKNMIQAVLHLKKTNHLWIGFSCQNTMDIATAYQKLQKSHLDAIIINSFTVINQDKTQVIILNRDKSYFKIGFNTKKVVAGKIIKYILNTYFASK